MTEHQPSKKAHRKRPMWEMSRAELEELGREIAQRSAASFRQAIRRKPADD